jgi:hypothetical protein
MGQDMVAVWAGAGTGRSAWGAGEDRLCGRMQEEIGAVTGRHVLAAARRQSGAQGAGRIDWGVAHMSAKNMS